MARRRRYGIPSEGGPKFGGNVRRYGGGRRRRTTEDYEEDILSSSLEPGDEPPAIRSALSQALSGEPPLQEALLAEEGAGPKLDTSRDWYRPFYMTDEMWKASRTLQPGEDTAADKATWMPRVEAKPRSWGGAETGYGAQQHTLSIPGQEDRAVGPQEAKRWEKKPDESWEVYKQRILYLTTKPEMTEVATEVIRTDAANYGDVVSEYRHGGKRWIAGERPNQWQLREDEHAGVPTGEMTTEELRARNMQRVLKAPSFLENPSDWTGRLIIGAMATKPALVGRFMAKYGEAFGNETLMEMGKDLQSLLPAEGGSLPLIYNIATRIPDIMEAVANALPAGAFTPGSKMDWGSVTDYAIERAHIRGEERRFLEYDEIGHFEEVEGLGARDYATRKIVGALTGRRMMARSTEEQTKLNPFTPFASAKFYKNTAEELHGLMMILPMAFSGAGYLGGRDPMEERIAEIGKFGAEIAGHVGEHVGMLMPWQMRYGSYIEQGAISAIADPLIILAPVKGFLAARVAARMDRAGLARLDVMGQETAAAHGEHIATTITKLETEAAAAKTRLSVLRGHRAAGRRGRSLPGTKGARARAKAEIVELSEILLRKQALLQRLKVHHGNYEALVERGWTTDKLQKLYDVEAVDLYTPGRKIVGNQLYKHGEQYRSPLEAIVAAGDQVATADAHVLRAQEWLRANGQWQAAPSTTMTAAQLGKWIRQDGTPRTSLLKTFEDLIKPAEALETAKTGAAEIGKVTTDAVKLAQENLGKAFDKIPDEVAYRFRESIRAGLADRGSAGALTVFEEKLSRIYSEATTTTKPAFVGVEGPRLIMEEAGGGLHARGVPQMASTLSAEWLPGGARPKIPAFAVKEAFFAPWEMTLGEFTVEWNNLLSQLKSARSGLSRSLRERLDRGELAARDLRRRGWTPVEIHRYERLRAMAGQHNIFAAPQTRYILKDLKRLHKKGLAGAEESATLRADANVKALGAAKDGMTRTAAELEQWAAELEQWATGMAEAGMTPTQALKHWTKEAELARVAQGGAGRGGLFGALETEVRGTRKPTKTKAELAEMEPTKRAPSWEKRGKHLDPKAAELLDRAEMWHKMERFVGHVMRFAEPFTAATQVWRYRNRWIDNYGLAGGKKRFEGAKRHEWTMAQRYWTRNRNHSGLAARRALQREAEAEVTEFQFRSIDYLREVSEYDRHYIAAGDTLDSIAAKYATPLKPKSRVKQEIIRDNQLDLLRRQTHGPLLESGRYRYLDALEEVPAAYKTPATAIVEVEKLIDAYGAYFWEHLPRSVLYQQQDIMRLIMDTAANPGTPLNLRLVRKQTALPLEQRAAEVARAVLEGNEAMTAEIRVMQKNLREVRLTEGEFVLREGDLLRVKDTDMGRMRTRQKTVFEAMHYSDIAEARTAVYRDAHAPAGHRFTVREGADNAAYWESWSRTANAYDLAVDLSKELTLQSLQVNLLKATDNLYEIWASNWYSNEGRRAATKRRILEGQKDQRLLDGYAGMTKKQKKYYDDLRDVELSEKLQIFDAVETNAMGGQTFEGLKGAAERKRKLGDPESGIPLEQRINEYGMSADLQDLVLEGMMNQKRDIATARMWRKMREDNTMFSDVQKLGWYEVKNATLEGTNLRKFGKELPETFYLHPDVYWDFQGLSKMMKRQGHWLVQSLSYWKAFKTALAPQVHATNILSNLLFLGPMHGLSPWDPRAIKAMGMATKEFALGTKSPAYRAWINTGGSPAGGLNRIEMVTDAQRAFGKMMFGAVGRGKEGFRIAGEMFKSTVTLDVRGAGNAFKQLNYDLPGLMYSAGDDFFRFSLFLLKTGRYLGDAKRAALIKKGRVKFLTQAFEGEAKLGAHTGRVAGPGRYYQFLDDVYASQLSRRAFARYEEMAGFMRIVSTSWFGKPFLAFDTTTIPMFVEWIKAKPLQAEMWKQMYESVTDINFRKSQMTYERAEKMKAELPEWAQTKMMMLRKIAPELAKSDTGAERYFNALKYGIGGRLIRQKNETMGEWLQRVAGSENPGYSALLYATTGIHPYFRTKLDKDDPNYSLKIAMHAYQSFTPGYMPGNYTFQRMNDSGFRFWGPNELGRPRYGRGIDERPWQALLAILGGVDLQEYDPLLRSEQAFKEEQMAGGTFKSAGPTNQIKALKKRYASNKERYATTPEELRKAFKDLYAVDYERAREKGAQVAPVTDAQLDREVAQTEALRHHTLKNMILRAGARAQVYRTAGRNTVIDMQHKKVELDRANAKHDVTLHTAEKAAFGADDWAPYQDSFKFIENNQVGLGDGWADVRRIKTYETMVGVMINRRQFSRALAMAKEIQFLGDDAIDAAVDVDDHYNITTWYDKQVKRIARKKQLLLRKRKGRQ